MLKTILKAMAVLFLGGTLVLGTVDNADAATKKGKSQHTHHVVVKHKKKGAVAQGKSDHYKQVVKSAYHEKNKSQKAQKKHKTHTAYKTTHKVVEPVQVQAQNKKKGAAKLAAWSNRGSDSPYSDMALTHRNF